MSEQQALQRGRLLYNAEHYDQAGEMFVEVLRVDPQNAEAQALLALCLSHQKKWKGAIEAAREAVRLDPEEPLAHEALAVIYLNSNRLEEAERAILQALELEPDSPTYWHLAGHLAWRRSDWQTALESAQRGLASDPSSPDLINLRSLALMKLGHVEESRQGLAELLAENPEDPSSLANMGWSSLHVGKPGEALEYFKSALQLEPENDYARQGLMEGLRARYPFYGLVLRFFFFMQGLSKRAQEAIELGLYLGQRLLNELAREHRWLRPYVRPILFLYTMFAYMTWLAKPLANLLLRFNPYGKLVLTREDEQQSNVVAGCLGLTTLFAVIHVATGNVLAFVTWAFFLTVCVPLASIFECEEGWPRKLMKRVALLEAAVGVLGLLMLWLGMDRGVYFISIYFQLVAPTQFLIVYLRNVRPELGHED